MKKPVQKFGKQIILFALGCLILTSCSKDDTPDNKNPDPTPEEQATPKETEDPVNLDANKITQSLKFRNGTIINGTMPLPSTDSSKRLLSDLKIDTDTIFWVEGITNHIKILKPSSPLVFSGTFYATVTGSDSYVEAEFEVEKENDTLVFLNFDFDLSGWEPPLSFEIQIVPKDNADGLPLDDFQLPVVIEERIEDLNNNGGEDYWTGYWYWIETIQNNIHHTGPFENINQAATVGLCCDGLGGVYNCFSSNPDYQEMDFTIDYFVVREYLYFDEISDVRGVLREMSNNLDWENSNVCDNEPAYIGRIVHNPFTGTFTEINSNTRTIDNLIGESEAIYLENVHLGDVPLPIYAGSGPFVEYTLLSKHFIKEVRNNPEGGPGPDGGKGDGLERIYYKRFSNPNAEFEETIWFNVCGVCVRN